MIRRTTVYSILSEIQPFVTREFPHSYLASINTTYPEVNMSCSCVCMASAVSGASPMSGRGSGRLVCYHYFVLTYERTSERTSDRATERPTEPDTGTGTGTEGTGTEPEEEPNRTDWNRNRTGIEPDRIEPDLAS